MTLDDGSKQAADHAVAGAPSVLFDTVALLPSADGAATLGAMPEARDFVTDAVAHDKFLAVGPDASGLLEAAGVASKKDGGFVDVADAAGAKTFVEACRDLRFWKREAGA